MRRLLATIRSATVIAIVTLAACAQRPAGPIEASVIDPPADRTRQTNAAGRLALALRGATGSGLLRFDQSGQLVSGAAIRWAMVEDGTSGIFRIDDSSGLSAPTVARRLRAALAGPGWRFFAYGMERVAAVTDVVVELRLSEPRSDLLSLLAAPELATLAPAGGPMRIAGREGDALLLVPRVPLPQAATAVRLRGEQAGKAIARFAAGRSMLVLGGTFDDLPIARAAGSLGGTLRVDHATGLFGLAARRPLDPALLHAIDLAIDRDRLLSLIGAPGQAKATTIGGSQIEPPHAQRLSEARALLGGRTALVQLALPAGPGGTLLLRSIAHDLARIGIVAERAASGAAADLALIDMVVPPGERARAACLAAFACDPADKQAILAPAFVALAAPIRWSLAAAGLDLFTPNALAAHPLDRLRTAP